MSAIVISPVDALIWKIPSPLPDTIVQLCRLPVVSGSVAVTVPTDDAFAADSDTSKLCPASTTGTVSLTSVTLTVTVSVADVATPSETSMPST